MFQSLSFAVKCPVGSLVSLPFTMRIFFSESRPMHLGYEIGMDIAKYHLESFYAMFFSRIVVVGFPLGSMICIVTGS